MREIARFSSPEEAKIALGYLRAQGFDVQLPDEHVLDVRPELALGLGGYRLVAADRDAFMAKAMLDEKRPKTAFAACDACGSDSVRRTRAWPFPLALFALFGELFPFAPAKDQLVCRACGHRWKDDDHESGQDL